MFGIEMVQEYYCQLVEILNAKTSETAHFSSKIFGF